MSETNDKKICSLDTRSKSYRMSYMSRLSYLYTSPPKPFNYTTLPRVVAENAKSHPYQELFVIKRLDGSRTSLTNTSLYYQGSQLARYLVSIGIQKGDKVALIGPNTLEMVVGHVGIMCAGAVVLNVNIKMKSANDAKEMFQLTDTKCAIIDSGEKDEILPAVKSMLHNSDHQRENGKEEGGMKIIFLRSVRLGGFKFAESLQNISQMEMTHVALPNTYPEDPAIIFTTSGSTGNPKMVLHTYFSLASYPFTWIAGVDYEITEYNDRPFSWIGGSPAFYIMMRRSRIFMDASVAIEGKNTLLIWQVIKEEKCNNALLLPYFVLDLLDLPLSSTNDGYKLRHIVTGGQLINRQYTRILDRFCHYFYVAYGSTEVIATAMQGPLVKGDIRMTGEVGRPFPGVEIRIVDDQELPVPLNTVGKVQVRGPGNMNRYYGNQQLAAESFTSSQWFRTGDIGKISFDEKLTIHGRENDVISRGGRKIYPGMLEDLIKQIPSIKNVCVVPVPDRRLYNEICVCFVKSGASTLMEEDVKKFCDENIFTEGTIDGLGAIPAYYLEFEEFPSLSNGKPNQITIRKEAASRLKLSGD